MRRPIRPLTLHVLVGISILVIAALPATAFAEQMPCKMPPPLPKLDPKADPLVVEIAESQAAFREAYHQMQADELGQLYDDKAVWAGTLHPYWMEGRSKIQEMWILYFGLYPCPQIVFWSSSLRELSHNPHTRVFGQHATATMVMPDRSGQVRYTNMRLSVIWVRVDDGYTHTAFKGAPSRKLFWRIAHMHGSEAPPSTR